MTVANYLTFFRLLIAPLFLIVYKEHEFLGISSLALPYVLMVILGLSEITDAVDGYIARKYNQVTDLGKILDPMVDSVARTAVFLTFTAAPINLPLFFIFIFLYRDSMMGTLRTMCALKGFALAASRTGKTKAIIQALSSFSILVLLIPHSLELLSDESLQQLSFWIASFAASYTVYSAAEYLVVNRSYIRSLA